MEKLGSPEIIYYSPEIRRLSSNCEMGTKSVSGLLPVQAVRFLWELTQGRLHERREQPGHLYFDGFFLHSSHKRGSFLLSGAEVCSGFSSIAAPEREIDDEV